MKNFNKPVYLAAGAYTISLGTGRNEFHPKKPRPGLDYYIQEAGKAVLSQINSPENIDEGVIANFMAARFNRQGNLASLMTTIHPSLVHKPMIRVEGACASGGLGIATGVKNILSGLADVVLVVGVEVQNTVKAIYGADILAGAGYYAGERKEGHTYFFPAKFSDRAGAYFEKYGKDITRQAMAHWYANAVENARLNPLAQEYHNTCKDLVSQGMTQPDAKTFTEHLNIFDCSKVSDGAAAILVCSEEGYKKLGLNSDAVCEIIGLGQVMANLISSPADLTELDASRKAANDARDMANVGIGDIGVFEVHDCFTISGLLSIEALGIVGQGKAPELVINGETKLTGKYPVNTGGGLVGYGHPTGASGVRMAVDLWKQMTGKAEKFQVDLKKEHGMLISMGGNDKSLVSVIVKK
ncbi:MAG: 3-ketoacyl-CoA thiolase [Candidatus Coatesbacteria bacterium]|nr:3-ketoacyl-CoA thiolase [Candidatus Coatesbacteria bacterium]